MYSSYPNATLFWIRWTSQVGGSVTLIQSGIYTIGWKEAITRGRVQILEPKVYYQNWQAGWPTVMSDGAVYTLRR